MSSASEESWEELAKRQLAEFTVTTHEYRAENQRYEVALVKVSAETCEKPWLIAREALAGDTP